MVYVPSVKRAVAFVDGQNLYHATREAFGSHPPETDIAALARSLCARRGWRLAGVRYYTGVPDPRENPAGHRAAAARLAALARHGVHVFTRPLRYRPRVVRRPDGSAAVVRAGQEKGIDVRIALDILELAHRRAYDVALVFSQDQDLSEAAVEVRRTAAAQGRWMQAASAYPCGPRSHNRRGIDGTVWIRIDRSTLDAFRSTGPAPRRTSPPPRPDRDPDRDRSRHRRRGRRRSRRRPRRAPRPLTPPTPVATVVTVRHGNSNAGDPHGRPCRAAL